MEQEELSLGEFIRLTARVLSVASIFILLMILLNKGNYPRSASLEDLGLFLCFPVGICLGMIFFLEDGRPWRDHYSDITGTFLFTPFQFMGDLPGR